MKTLSTAILCARFMMFFYSFGGKRNINLVDIGPESEKKEKNSRKFFSLSHVCIFSESHRNIVLFSIDSTVGKRFAICVTISLARLPKMILWCWKTKMICWTLAKQDQRAKKKHKTTKTLAREFYSVEKKIVFFSLKKKVFNIAIHRVQTNVIHHTRSRTKPTVTAGLSWVELSLFWLFFFLVGSVLSMGVFAFLCSAQKEHIETWNGR